MNLDELRKKADRGNVVAQSILGICYLEGHDVEVNFEEALRLLSAAASAGAPRAITALARMHAEGLGTPKDINEAIRLYTTAAEKGEFQAQIALGRIYSRGVTAANLPMAAKWYSAAVSQKNRVQDCPELREAKHFLERV